MGYPPGWGPGTGWSGRGAPGSKGATVPGECMGPEGRPPCRVRAWGPKADHRAGRVHGAQRTGTARGRPRPNWSGASDQLAGVPLDLGQGLDGVRDPLLAGPEDVLVQVHG